MQKPTPTTFILMFMSVLLLSLAGWSLHMNLSDNMRLKGIVLAVYGLGLMAFALFARLRLRRIMVVGMVAVLVGGEMVTRLTADPEEDPDFRQGAPYLMFAGQPNGEIESFNIRLSSLGYRDEVPMPKPDNEYRIIMLGGSALFQGTPREFSIAGSLENTLHEQGYTQVEIYNWGIYSTVSGQELAAMVFRAVDFAPDMVVVYNGSNDLTEPYFFDPRPGYPFDYMAVEGSRRLIEGDFSLFDLYAVLMRPTRLGYTLFQFEIEEQITRQSDLKTEADFGSEGWREAILQQYIANLTKMCTISRAFDVEFVALLQPMIFFKDTLTGKEPSLLGPPDYQHHTRTLYEQARLEYQNLSAAYSECTFRDVSRLPDTQELFVDPVHLTNDGYSIVGRRLAEIFIPIIEEN
ncbi:MAG: hypothetical protein K8I82_28435 [Anaerolineae bacterium]|nr:hypothetical protein [Anaerolineae bacterium]